MDMESLQTGWSDVPFRRTDHIHADDAILEGASQQASGQGSGCIQIGTTQGVGRVLDEPEHGTRWYTDSNYSSVV
jgi:hypothetical protein